MIERTPMLIVAALAALTVSACGDRSAVPGAGGAGPASEEPIDAVPLPLDDNPLSPPPPVAAAAEPETKDPVVAEEAGTAEPATAASAAPATPGAPLDASTKPARIVVAPREPSRPVERPVERPAPPPAPEKEPEKPVLTF